MFLDIAPSEFLLTAAVAIVVIGPKDMPRALRAAGRWIGKMRRVSNHFRAGIENMIREAELEDMEKQWREQNEAIMRSHPTAAPLSEASPPEPYQPLPIDPQATPAVPHTPAAPPAPHT